MKPLDLDQFSITQKRFRTDYLFPTPSFFKGFGSVINLFGSKIIHVTSENENDADSIALRNDFNMVGQDIFDSIEKVKQESKLALKE